MMRVAKAIGLGFLLAVTAMFGMGFFAIVLGMESSVAGMLEGLAFMGGLGLGVYLVYRGDKHKPPQITVPPEEWGRREQDGQ